MVAPASRVTRRLICGDARGQAPAGAAEQPESVVGEQDVVGVGGDAPARAGWLLGAVVGACERGVGVGKHEELEVVVAERELLEALEHLGERSWARRRRAG